MAEALFKLPSVSKKYLPWEAFEVKIANIFRYAMGCTEAEKTRLAAAANFEIDCLAKNDDTIYVVECKTKDELSKTSQKLKEYIITFAGKKVSIGNALRFEDKTRELVFILCTDGFVVTDDLKKLAADNHIYLWDTLFIKNIENLYNAIGPRVKQYINYSLGIQEFIEDGKPHATLKIPTLSYESVIGGSRRRMFNLFMSAEHLLDLGYVYHITSGDPDAYQRIIKASRLRGIADFINDDNTFNSSIVIIFDDDVKFTGLGDQGGHEYKTGFIYPSKRKCSVKIIDGQHRLYAYEWADDSHKKDKIPVIALEGLSASEQAKIFLDINDHQKPVKKDELNIIMARIDPYGTGFLPNVVLSLGIKGTFKDKIKTPLSTKSNEPIIFANAVKGLSDRKLFSTQNPLLHSELKKPDQNVVEDCAALLSGYYSEVIEVAANVDSKWVNEFIYTNNGFNILLHLLEEIGKYYGKYRKLSDPVQRGLFDFFSDNLTRIDEIRGMSSEGGRRDNAKSLIYEINKYDKAFGAKLVKDFTPREKREVKTKGEYLEQISDIENALKTLIKTTLDKKAGSNWWIVCVPESIRDRVDVYMRNETLSYLDVKDSGTREDYLTYTDIALIIDRNWKHFDTLLRPKYGALNAIETLKHVRDKLSHGKSVEDLSDDEIKSFIKAHKKLNDRLEKINL
jgi:DGQHR domain-containing protein